MNFKSLLFLFLLLMGATTNAQVTKIQLINNSPDMAHQSFDIYVDGMLFYNDLNFRESTPFLDIPFTVNTPVNIGIAEQNSVIITDTFLNVSTLLSSSETFVAVINGLRSTSGYTPSPKISLDMYNMGQIGANLGFTNWLFANGATDAPIMDMRTQLTNLANDVGFRSFGKYTEFSSASTYIFRLTNPAGNKVTHTYMADISTLNVDSRSAVVLTSGFLNTAANSNGPSFGLWMARQDGGAMIPLDTSHFGEKLARVQLIHNSPDTAMQNIDVYVNNRKTVSGLKFREATDYMDAYAGQLLTFTFTKHDSTTPMHTQSTTLDSGSAYATVLYGIHDSSLNYNPSPPLELGIYAFAREEGATSSSASLLFMHSGTDMPIADVKQNNGSTVVTDLAYGKFSNYLTGVTSPGSGNKYYISIDTASSNKFMNKFELMFDAWSLGGKTVTIVFSGFKDTASNSEGANLGLWAALPAGGPLRELKGDPITPPQQSIANISEFATYITVVPNPVQNLLTFKTGENITRVAVLDVTGKIVTMSEGGHIQQVDVNALNTGIYTVLLQSLDGALYYSRFNKL